MKIGVYCGSFNPVHKGHVKIAKSIVEQNLVDEVLVVVTGNYWNKKDLLPIKDRIKMWKFYEDDRIIVDETHNTIEKTYQLFRALKQENPNDEFSLILGGDNVETFDRWVNYEELLENPFIVVARNDINKEDLKTIFEEKFKKNSYSILDIPLLDISSTEIRENLNCYDVIEDKIDRFVFDYYNDLLKNKSNGR